MFLNVPTYQSSVQTAEFHSSRQSLESFELPPTKRQRLTLEPSAYTLGKTQSSHLEDLPVGPAQLNEFTQACCWETISEQDLGPHGPTTVCHERGGECKNEDICFGMLLDIEATPMTEELDSKLLWVYDRVLKSADSGQGVFKLSERIFEIMLQLATDGNVKFQFLRQQPATDVLQGPAKGDTLKAYMPSVTKLNVVLYGPEEASADVGDFLQECRMYLQRPEGCDRNVRYINPHCLSADEEAHVMTFELDKILDEAEKEDSNSVMDVLSYLNSEEVYEEADQPRTVRTQLKSHQRQALSFMLAREQGWCLDGSRSDLWKADRDSHGNIRYRNSLTGHSQIEPPPPFQGGIVADEMGLGKTLSILALIASHPTVTSLPTSFETNRRLVRTTLIVVPVSLLQVWELQIQTHLHPSSIHSIVYYGASRQRLLASLDRYDVVLTTYNTISTDWKRHRSSREDVANYSLFSIEWHRIVLDEAHVIRSKKTVNSKAVNSLDSTHRWCITGTPIQNRLSDLHSLLRFLRVHPFDDTKVFEDEIAQPWKCEMDAKGVQKLQSLMKMIAIRRPRAVVSLPSRAEQTRLVQFDEQELALYEQARSGTLQIIEVALSEIASGKGYINAFQRLNDLRFICNHGTALSRDGLLKYRETASSSHHLKLSEDELEDLFFSADGQVCIRCGTDLDEEIQTLSFPLPTYSLDSTTINPRLCKACTQRQRQDSSWTPLSPSSSPGGDAEEAHTTSINVPSKIRALVACLSQIPADEKCAVFSYWTTTLGLVEQALTAAGITYCRYDGRLSRGKRNEVLNSFATNATLSVILVSITCGGQGLDLTAANHAVLIEPQWNPMLEEQALSRVHRIGQMKPVMMTRLIVEGTWEEKIVEAQKRKRFLADLIMGRARLRGGDHGRRQLMVNASRTLEHYCSDEL
jgi:SWI/SNF-related matrix-associated actin-dependent regulator of chromatin subfamily A3